ncbi:MAG: hypothetical protein AAFY09_11465 [Pseudomonadota bacterium]
MRLLQSRKPDKTLHFDLKAMRFVQRLLQKPATDVLHQCLQSFIIINRAGTLKNDVVIRGVKPGSGQLAAIFIAAFASSGKWLETV